jgi:hypothetical protein
MSVRVELIPEGVRAMLRSEEVQQRLMEEAAQRCPDGCALSEYVGRNRANVRITTATEEAYREHLEYNLLEKAIGR